MTRAISMDVIRQSQCGPHTGLSDITGTFNESLAAGQQPRKQPLIASNPFILCQAFLASQAVLPRFKQMKGEGGCRHPE